MLARNPHMNFFSFIRLDDPSLKREYNEWHQLDHLPENRALPGVIWGDRWELTEDCRALARGEGQLQNVDYMGLYWFDTPSDDAIADWTQLGEDSFQWGRGPLIPGVQRELLAFFKPVKGYTTPEARVSAEVLPMRPHTGIHVTVTEFDDAHSLETHETHYREDRQVIPELLQLDGVIGAWTFSFNHSQRHSSLPFDESPEKPQGSMRIRVLFLEGDPLVVTPHIDAVEAKIPSPDAGTLLLAAPLRTIIPWQDW